MRANGVRTVVRSESLSVVGLVEVIAHIPRIYGEYRKLAAEARREKPDLAILTDSSGFHLKVAGKLAEMGIPIAYLIAPQAWAWRQGRVKKMRRTIRRLFCIFPFEEKFFSDRGVPTTFIGHPLARTIGPSCARADFLARHGLSASQPVVVLLPGSRSGEIRRHMPHLIDCARILRYKIGAQMVWAAPAGFDLDHADPTFRERISASSIQLIVGETWDAIAHSDLAIAASGTVTMEAALLGTPMVTFYRVTQVSWLLGKLLVKTPFYAMVNLIAGRKIVPELMQNEVTGNLLAEAALPLLQNPDLRDRMRLDLKAVAVSLETGEDPMRKAAKAIWDEFLGDVGTCVS